MPRHANRAYRLREEVSRGAVGAVGREGLDGSRHGGEDRGAGFETGSFGTVLWIAAAEQQEAQTLHFCMSLCAKGSGVGDLTDAVSLSCPSAA